jgi:CPA2 family monovalent cation:H+ antiporter-2
VPLVAIWRNVGAIAMILAESFGGGSRVPAPVVRSGITGVAAVGLGYWLHAILPTEELGGWGWLAIGVAAAVVVTVFSSRLIYWHSQAQATVRDVLAEDPKEAGATAARGRREQDLRAWELHLAECTVPAGAAYAGQTLAELAIPTRFGCALIEAERNGIVITTMRPDLRLYPGDKLLLMGRTEQLADATKHLSAEKAARDQSDEFGGSVLETFAIPETAPVGRTLAQLNLAQVTGTRIVGIRRGAQKIIAPSGQERLEAGDNVLVAGTLAEIGAFRRWLNRVSAPA